MKHKAYRVLCDLPPGGLAVGLAAMATLLSLAAGVWLWDGVPHVGDEAAYRFQARVFAAGQLWVPTPDYADSFFIPFVVDWAGRRFAKYPPGYPLLLAPGMGLGVPWLINPLLAGGAVWLLYQIGREVYDARTGLIGAALAVSSSFLWVNGGSYMAHPASLFWLSLFAWLALRAQRGEGRMVLGLGAGAAWGIGFLCRPLTAVAVGVPLGGWTVVRLVRQKWRGWQPALAMGGTAALVGGLLLAYQAVLAGDPTRNLYTLYWSFDRLGFGPERGLYGYYPVDAVRHVAANLSMLGTYLLGSTILSGVLLGLGLAVSPRRGIDRALLLPIGALVVAYAFWWFHVREPYGPRFYLEGAPGLWLLAAVGLRKGWRHAAPRRWTRRLFVPLIVGLMAFNLGVTWPSVAGWAHGYLDNNRSRLEPVRGVEQPALVLVVAEDANEFTVYADQNDLKLEGAVLFARSRGAEADAQLLAALDARHAYYLAGGQLLPLGTSRP